MAQSNGGINQTSRISAYPMTTLITGAAALWAYDPSLGYNDPNNPTNYFWRVEELVPGTTPTVNRVIVMYRDLGVVNLTFNLSATNDLQQVVSVSTGLIQWGNVVPTGRIMTQNLIGLTLTGQNFQLSVSRAANAGPLAIIKVILRGTVESS